MLQSRQGEYDAVSRNSRRAAIAVAGVFAVAPLVSACAAGQHPQSALPTQLNEGVNASAHLVDIRNAFLLGPASGQKLAAGDSAPLYAWFVNNAASADRLVAVEASGAARSAEIAGGSLDLPPSRLITTVQPPAASQPPSAAPSVTPTPPVKKTHAAKPRRTPGAGRSPKVTVTPTPGASTPAGTLPVVPPPSPSTSSKVILRGLTKSYSGGETVRLTLHFQQAGTISLNVPVVPRNGYYSSYSPAPTVPTPSATPPVAPPTAPPTATDKSKTQKTRTHQAKTRRATSKKRPTATPSA
jgi:copper(I)-binding protein